MRWRDGTVRYLDKWVIEHYDLEPTLRITIEEIK